MEEVYPLISGEHLADTVILTNAEMDQSIKAEYPIPVLMDHSTPLLTDEQDADVMAQPAAARDRARAVYDAANRAEAREANAEVECDKVMHTGKIQGRIKDERQKS